LAETDPSPIVLQPVGDFLVVPLQGPLTKDLLRDLSASLLAYLRRTKPVGVIFDMAGIQVLDAQDFENLKALAASARLMGTSTVFAGIQPGAAAGLTMLDIDGSWMRAARTVERAMSLFK